MGGLEGAMDLLTMQSGNGQGDGQSVGRKVLRGNGDGGKDASEPAGEGYSPFGVRGKRSPGTSILPPCASSGPSQVRPPATKMPHVPWREVQNNRGTRYRAKGRGREGEDRREVEVSRGRGSVNQ